jgi:hypothetical protein
MPCFMAEMTKQRAVWFAQVGAPLFPFGVVGLGQIQGDNTVLMTRKHHRARVIDQNLERQAEFRIFDARFKRQPQPQQPIEQMMFCQLKLSPSHEIRFDRKIGNDSVVTARRAECVLGISREQPIAGAHLRVRAKAKLVQLPQRQPPVSGGLQSVNSVRCGNKTKVLSAGLTYCIFEIYNI